MPARQPQRGRPHGHHGTTPGLLTARLTVTITAVAPLLVRGAGTDAAPALPENGAGVPIVPGSGLHGAIRSLHETLTGSCLRVVDTGWIPSYRQQADGREIPRKLLALVVDPNRPRLRLCAAVDAQGAQDQRLHMNILERLHADAGERGLRSGDRLDVTFDAEGRAVDATWNPQGGWVLFLSDPGARVPDKPYRAAVRELTAQERDVPGPVWTTFHDLLDTADDLRPERLKEDGEHNHWKDVVFPPEGNGRVLGKRSLARHNIQVGQPLWVLLDAAGEITEVRMAQLWRKFGAGPVADRIGAHAPCTDPDDLCPSCRLFGSADVTGQRNTELRQRSYRGHVRFSDAVATTPVTPQPVFLPPSGAPKPGAGQFYLQTADHAGDGAGTWPLREWGSRADDVEWRRIRGRKFYWHTPPPGESLPPRGVARRHHRDKERAVAAVLFPAGTTFTAAITAVDVDETQLGGLLAALDPSGLLDTPDALVHLGGGRPLGYGSCRVEIDDARTQVWRSAARYGARTSGDTAMLLATARAAFAATGADHVETWRQLGAALSGGAVAGEHVWYPPGGGRQGEESYDAGFEFWRQSSGKELSARDGKRMGYPLTVLPTADAPDQRLRIVERERKGGFPLTNGKQGR